MIDETSMFADRRDAGARLAQRLRRLRGPDLVVLGLSRGGVPVAAEVALALDAPLDVLVVRRLRAPRRPDVSLGAVGEGGVRLVNRQLMHVAGVREEAFEAVERHEREALRHQITALRQGRRPASLAWRNALIVDDGMATGAVAEIACQIARARGAARVILAMPVAAPPAWQRLSRIADDAVCLAVPTWFGSIGDAYRDFRPVSDEDAVGALERTARRASVRRPAQAAWTAGYATR